VTPVSSPRPRPGRTAVRGRRSRGRPGAADRARARGAGLVTRRWLCPCRSATAVTP